MLDNKTIKFPFSEADLKMLTEYDSYNRPVYIGQAHPGVATTAAQWQIRKLTYSGVTSNCTAVEYASGSNDYNAVWDDRATYVYS